MGTSSAVFCAHPTSGAGAPQGATTQLATRPAIFTDAANAQRHPQPRAGKLKDLGNSLLGHFGMSLDNFKAVQDPGTGSYSVQFQQGGAGEE